jgi:hypothetical protein
MSLVVLAVAKDSASQKAAAVASFVARSAFARNPRYQLLDLEAFLDESADNTGRAAVSRALEALDRGGKALDALEIEPALASLNEAVVAFEQGAAYVDNLNPYVDALLKLGCAYALNADNNSSREAFRRALILDRAAVPEKLPPQAKRPFEEAGQKVDDAPRGALNVFTTPGAAEVYVDGVFRGASPIIVDRIAAGPHFVRVVKPGHRGMGRMLKTSGKGEETFQVVLKPTLKFAELENITSRIHGDVLAGQGPAIIDLARFAKVDQVLVMSVVSTSTDVRVAAVLADGTGHPVASGQRSFAGERYRAEMDDWMETGFRGGQSGTAAPKDLPTQTTSNYAAPGGGGGIPGLPKIIAGVLVMLPIPLALIMGGCFACTSIYAALVGWSLLPYLAPGPKLDFLRQPGTMVLRVLIWVVAGVVLGVAFLHPPVSLAALAGGIALIIWGQSEKASMDAILSGGGSDVEELAWPTRRGAALGVTP